MQMPRSSGVKVPYGEAVHRQGVDRLLRSYSAIPADAPVRLAKKTSNLFRARAAANAPGLDVSGLGGVISVDPQARTADVAGMCTYEDLVDATLPYGLAPLVVPQLKTITLGGAVTGLGIESTSFRNGLPHESVLEMDILTGSGEIITARPEGEHADLFHGFPNSYGSLGYATRLRIALEPVKRFVALRHLRFDTIADLQSALARIVDERTWDGTPVDYLDGVVFSATESYLTLGTQTDEPGPVSDYTGQDIYYRSIQHVSVNRPKEDRLTIRDYLWRWDTDWFWCSRAFGAQNPKIRRMWPKQLLRSSFYWKLIALDHKYSVADRIEARKGNPPRERVVQDIEVPLERTQEFVEWFLDEIPIEPIWLCPLKLRDIESSPDAGRPSTSDAQRPWPLYPLEPKRAYVNVGFWSSVPIVPGAEEGAANRLIEKKVAELDGHKSLYSDSYYSKDEFEKLYYGGGEYPALKQKYDPRSRLLDLFSKAVQRK
ncbi:MULTISPECIES: FAD-binding oxidoreductase [Rhodococcus]|uniref:Delta(24)-sterol reductase n=1 Tax=Rhodococcus pyridinivorans TaxID=103816 RepID=A0A7M2XN44_9NOCA|nr:MULTISPECIES: FAD-binding oxidoreductase [Rhodococcus]AOD21570.1 FAD-linked oxidase [Rhodococcus sp. p52]KHJ71327.1 FAD-linked oxidase [Rhodococcus sp. Chr-9]MBX4171009.1 FAD-binding oxidoreductase [Rhodococcus sp. DMU2021]MCW3472364.1 FAD-binding oxidoreductase [Rhodococcus pyridinivorans]OBA39835.1 FAD-linked oxidase [Rhodococcus sp. 852002-51564_SCH6189132-a]